MLSRQKHVADCVLGHVTSVFANRGPVLNSGNSVETWKVRRKEQIPLLGSKPCSMWKTVVPINYIITCILTNMSGRCLLMWQVFVGITAFRVDWLFYYSFFLLWSCMMWCRCCLGILRKIMLASLLLTYFMVGWKFSQMWWLESYSTNELCCARNLAMTAEGSKFPLSS